MVLLAGLSIEVAIPCDFRLFFEIITQIHRNIKGKVYCFYDKLGNAFPEGLNLKRPHHYSVTLGVPEW